MAVVTIEYTLRIVVTVAIVSRLYYMRGSQKLIRLTNVKWESILDQVKKEGGTVYNT